ncbi:hypothetical protein SAMN02745170_03652 [Propionispora hippei DSM 15287]|uniref:Uncharacterized protein n=1 Tax=Propionispora hippei DSM 15287 TaxID=1123003 RepID=A0A1M6N3I0_9FIRM|nr:hypothetical protein SAMN02745170_03652 [Propionispora hippei DSM 15287]
MCQKNRRYCFCYTGYDQECDECAVHIEYVLFCNGGNDDEFFYPFYYSFHVCLFYLMYILSKGKPKENRGSNLVTV